MERANKMNEVETIKNWRLIIDVEKCEDCNNCFLACKDEFVGNDFPGYSVSQPLHGHRWMNIMRKERGQYPLIDVAYLPTPCMQCDDAPCVKKAKNSAVYKRADGIVIIDPKKAKGQKDIVKSCPYGAIYWNEEEDVPQKCSLCAHLLDDGWKEPRCVQACAARAIELVNANEPEIEKIIDSEKLEVLRPEHKTKPRVYYKNLYQYNKCFIAGSVASESDGIQDCVEGAKVTLSGPDNNKIDETVTDNYGDFKFDNLEKNSGKYVLDMDGSGYSKKLLEVELKTSKNVGVVLLKK
jgi:sulfite dehydrogenase (quinone) subunit SoeB